MATQIQLEFLTNRLRPNLMWSKGQKSSPLEKMGSWLADGVERTNTNQN